jgi:hypothetical protein
MRGNPQHFRRSPLPLPGGSLQAAARLPPRTCFAKEDWIGGNSKRTTALAAALIKAHRFMYEDEDETVKIAAEATGFERRRSARR